MELVNAYLSGSEIVLLSRDESGNLIRKTAPPEYIVYVDAAQCGDDFMRDLSKSRYVRSLKKEGRWLRIGWSDRFIRDDMLFGRKGPDARPSPFEERGITTYEGDLHPVRRYITDHGVKIQRPRRAYFDLETDSRVPFSRKEEMRILSWAVVDTDGRRFSGVLEEDEDMAERDLLEQFFKTIAKFDQLLAWGGDNFDFPVLRARVDRRGLRVDIDRWLWLDQLALFKRMNTAAESGEEKTSMKLNSIGMALLGEGKHDFDASKTYKAWSNKEECATGQCMACRACLVRYNIQDVVLQQKIEAKTGSAALFDTVAEVCHVFPDSRGLNPTGQMDGFMLREGLEHGEHFVTKRYKETFVSEQYAGAFVMEPRVRGIEKDIHVCDFSGMYPSIILTWNMSPETKCDVSVNGPIEEGCCRSPVTRQGFRIDEEGLVAVALKKFIALRKEWNAAKAAATPGTPAWSDADRRSTAYKVVANSFYGVIGSPFSRFHDRRIAESVTLTGQWLIKATIAEAEKRGMFAIYGDTDSVYVRDATRTQFEEFVKWCNEVLYPRLVAECGCTENYVKLAYEKQFKRIVFTGAKHYAGVYAHYKGKEATADSKPEIKGLEFNRGDASLLARRLQEKVIQRMIVGGDERQDTYRGMLGEILKHVLHDVLPVEEVAISKAVTKPLKDYVQKKKQDGTDSTQPPHVRVAKILAERGQEVGEGTRISYVVLDGDGGINTPIPAQDFDGVTFDRYYLWESLIYPPTQRLLVAAFPESDWKTGLERVRPPKLRGRKNKALAKQLGLPIPKEDSSVMGTGDYVLAVREDFGVEGALAQLKGLAERHPGGMTLVLNVCLDSGAVAVVETPLKISGSPAFLLEVEELFWMSAAYRDWEKRCAN